MTREEVMEQFLEEAITRWAPTKMTQGLSKEMERIVVGALESQRQFNQQMYDDGMISARKRNVIPIVRRLMEKIDRSKVKLKTEVNFTFGRYNIIDPDLKFQLYDEEDRVRWESYCNKIDYEAEWTLEMTDKIATILNRDYKSINFKAIWYLPKCDTLVVYGDLSKTDPIRVCERKV